MLNNHTMKGVGFYNRKRESTSLKVKLQENRNFQTLTTNTEKPYWKWLLMIKRNSERKFSEMFI